MKKARREPTITQFIFMRMALLVLVLLGIYFIVLTKLLERREHIWIDMLLVAAMLCIVVFATAVRGRMLEQKFRRVNLYLETLEAPEKFEEEERFAIREFEEVWINLRKVLLKAKKREEDKSKYSAKLKLKNRQRSDMLSAIAHEFRNPISAIMGYSQTLQDDPNISPLLREKFLQKIYKNGLKIEELLSRILLWNKFESGEARYYLNNFDISLLVQEVVAALKEKYKERTIQMELESLIVYADRALMDVVLKNLIENALKYSQNRVVVKIKGHQIAVMDYGVGISEKDIEKVTKKFYRSGTHNWDNSMGLGLSIVENILKLHNTTLQIRSKIGEGSVFSFIL